MLKTIIVGSAFAVIAAGVQAQEASNCGPRVAITNQFIADGLKRKMIGDSPSGITQETWAHPDGTFWSTILVHPNGLFACVMSGGDSWFLVPNGTPA